MVQTLNTHEQTQCFGPLEGVLDSAEAQIALHIYVVHAIAAGVLSKSQSVHRFDGLGEVTCMQKHRPPTVGLASESCRDGRSNRHSKNLS